MVLNDIQKLSLAEINKMAAALGIEGTETRARHEVLFDIVRQCAKDPGNIIRTKGVLEVVKEGHGFLRNLLNSYTASLEDVYVSPLQIKRLRLRTGDTIVGQIRQPRENEQFFALLKIETVDGDDPDAQRRITPFEQLTPYFPTQRLIMERSATELSTRVIDLVTPVGRGPRGLIVAGPRTGKTVIMQKIANSIIANDPDVEVIILLVDERPEEVTDMQREVNAEVVSSTFDEPPDRHVQVAEMVIEKAKRLVEHGRHVVILLDSITRLARAYNTIQPHSGRILSGGVDANALHKPKRFFGAARNIEGGGSLTILATALVDTGSKMDEVIFEEFKGTGNMELHLDHRLVDRRVYPAIDVEQSGTRREELLVHKDELERIWALRRAFTALQPAEAMEELIRRLKKTENNIEFLLSLKLPQDAD
ncbi:MAG: transcription termination factor Rho [Victivallales bacterium]|nr:transcription termination factor Rho [Victivallales bacterium]